MSRALVIITLLVAGVTGTADAARKRAKANMPKGFVWPPSRTMVKAADVCEAKLAELGVRAKPAKRAGRIVRAFMLPADNQIGGITYTPAYKKHQVMDCQLVLALATFAPRLYELGVREVLFGSAFRWSKVRVNGRTKNALSRHALGIALDIVGFIDDTGRVALVSKDYQREDQLLLGIERSVNDSGMFRMLLTPANDPRSHSDHFHLEANPDYRADTEPRPST